MAAHVSARAAPRTRRHALPNDVSSEQDGYICKDERHNHGAAFRLRRPTQLSRHGFVSRALFGSRVRATEVISVKDCFVASLLAMTEKASSEATSGDFPARIDSPDVAALIRATAVARKQRIGERDQADLPCPDLSAKRFLFSLTPNHFYNSPRLTHERGVSRSSWTRDGMRWTLMVLRTNGTEADGEVVWS